MPAKKKKAQIDTYTHQNDTRRNIPTAEMEPVMHADKKKPITLAYERAARNTDLDPQLIWRGKDEQDQDDLVVAAPPLFTQEKIHPRALIEDLIKQSGKGKSADSEQLDLFADFNGLEDPELKNDYYEHDQKWSNRMILGDSLQVMASLASREGYQGKVQCIYIDPPYGIRFNSNFQWSTTTRDVRDGNRAHITREPEQVKAFRDTWRDGIHSYLTYLRDRLTVARDLLADSGSIFVQIGDENVHRVRAVMDEVFGEVNFCALIPFQKTSGGSDTFISSDLDYLLWYAKQRETVKYRSVLKPKNFRELRSYRYAVTDAFSWPRTMTTEERQTETGLNDGEKLIQISFLGSQDPGKPEERVYCHEGRDYDIGAHRHWKTTNPRGLDRLSKASRIIALGSQLNYKRYAEDGGYAEVGVLWNDVGSAGFSNTDPRVYVVQTDVNVVKRCILMTTDPSDLVLDPTCGAGTTAYVAEQWGRRWITIDTSRVALALARARIMGARYPYYLLADSLEGQLKEAEVCRRDPSESPTYGNVRQGFIYERVPHITLRDIANNAEIDVIWDTGQAELEPLREELNAALGKSWEEWEIPREADDSWPEKTANIHALWWERRIECQKEIDASIAARADFEYLCDKPYEDRSKVRVPGPFTVESLSPHRLLVSGDADQPQDAPAGTPSTNGHYYEGTAPERDFAQMIIENLRTSGVQQTAKEDRIRFDSIEGWPGDYICAEAEYTDGNSKKRAGVFVGPEFGTVGQPDLTAAAREAGQAGFDALISCAFSYDAHATEFTHMGAMPILKARMNADLHMATDLKNTGNGNLFVIFGEPDVTIEETENDLLRVKIRGIDIYDPSTGQVRSDDTDGIACWFIDTEYNEESFFIRHAYFLGANDPYKALKTTLKTEIDRQAWDSLNSDVSRPFPKPESGRIAVKVINHLGDEAMKVIRI